MRLCPANAVPARTPFPCLITGCEGGHAPQARVDRVLGAPKARRTPDEDPALFWEVAGKQRAGQSGGPLLDRKGRVLGICSGTNKDKSYFCHIEEIHAFLAKHKLQWLYEEEQPQGRCAPGGGFRVTIGELLAVTTRP